MHPLVNDLSNLSNEELHSKYNELIKKVGIASRTGSQSVVGQMYMVLDEYKNEINKRQSKLLDDITKNSSLKNIIDIK